MAYAHHVLRLTPIDRDATSACMPPRSTSTPAPVERREGQDFFGNRITWIALDQPHDTLTVRVAARIAVEPAAAAEPDATPAVGGGARRRRSPAPISAPQSPAHFLFPSRQVSLDPEIRDYARQSFPPGRPILAGAIDLMNRIKADFVYELGATTVSTTPPMSFALRRGVCQDFAHIMISGMRALGLPAAYVSGYLRTVPPPGEAGSKAPTPCTPGCWCGAGEAGWIGLDPTNGILAGDDHVVLAIGRDYADVAPIDGVIFASGGQRLETSVHVVPVG